MAGRAHPAARVHGARPRRRPTSTWRPGSTRSTRSPRGSPQPLCLTHFGRFDGRGRAARADPRVAHRARRAARDSTTRRASSPGSEAETARSASTPTRRRRFEQAAPPDQLYQGLERYWRKRGGGMSPRRPIEKPRIGGPGSGLGGNWRVIVLNDDHNTFEGVAAALAARASRRELDQGMRWPNTHPQQRPGDRLDRARRSPPSSTGSSSRTPGSRWRRSSRADGEGSRPAHELQSFTTKDGSSISGAGRPCLDHPPRASRWRRPRSPPGGQTERPLPPHSLRRSTTSPSGRGRMRLGDEEAERAGAGDCVVIRARCRAQAVERAATDEPARAALLLRPRATRTRTRVDHGAVRLARWLPSPLGLSGPGAHDPVERRQQRHLVEPATSARAAEISSEYQ